MQVQQHMAGYEQKSSLAGQVGLPSEASTEVGSEDADAERRLFISSTVIKGLEAMQISQGIPEEAEVRAILEGTLSDADCECRPNRPLH